MYTKLIFTIKICKTVMHLTVIKHWCCVASIPASYLGLQLAQFLAQRLAILAEACS